MLKVLINCGPAEAYIGHCLESLGTQTYKQWQAFVTVDPCGDATLERALAFARADDRIHITANSTRLYSMHNLVNAVARSGEDPEDVLVQLDGDDWLADEHALATIVDAYERHDCWLTYGSWIANGPIRRSDWAAYPDDTRDFRSALWQGTAIRTWKRWLWELVDDRDLRDDDGSYFRVVEDQAAMLPMLELATTRRARHVDRVLMVYNRLNPANVGKVMYDEMKRVEALVRARPGYAPLSEQPFTRGAARASSR